MANNAKQAQRVLVFGGTGYVGKAVVDELLTRGFRPLLFVRPGSADKVKSIYHNKVDVLAGELADVRSFVAELKFLQPVAVIYLVGLIREYPEENIRFSDAHFAWAKLAMEVAQEVGIAKFVYMSAHGAQLAATEYQRTKLRAEEYLRSTELNWTIIRPSVIAGASKDYHFVKVLQGLTWLPIVPLVGHGRFRLAPVYLGDIARAFVVSLTLPYASQTILTLCGPRAYSYKELLRLVARGPRLFIPIPVRLLSFLGRRFRYWKLFPITDDQITMLLQESVCEDSAVWLELGIVPRGMEQILEDY